ncbi:MAG: hypothetical protein ACLVAU_06955 [Ruminococcus sp.]
MKICLLILFAVAEKFAEPITNALCKTMGFVFDRKEKRKSFPNHYFKGDEKFIFYKSKNDERAFMIACEGCQGFWGISVKCKTEDKKLFMTQLNLICLKIVIIPYSFFEIDDFQDQLRGNFTKKTGEPYL